ncbi:CARD- and ANK-domain containing inflammasome adapter protein-like [Carya illinoinensis]|uniref:CARD- and ANK-domain containing inflammasome adapter protein-like n=1 Tax=Carya illinoinensis TaxID=32201 RepID=UPI001C71B888|nr:CARD- and ANK-domain containing inflammasome adapter protein-like [Carya illinoinensis]
MDKTNDFVNTEDTLRALTTPRRLETKQMEEQSRKGTLKRDREGGSKLKLSSIDDGYTSHGNEDNTVALYEASLDGSVSTLDTLMRRDRLILHKISLTSLTETPLHIAALFGHLQFTNALLRRRPQLVEKVDSSGRTALHLACAEGHTHVVKALLQANRDMCLVSAQEERIPLHLAAMRGHVEVTKELLIAHPRSISQSNTQPHVARKSMAGGKGLANILCQQEVGGLNGSSTAGGSMLGSHRKPHAMCVSDVHSLTSIAALGRGRLLQRQTNDDPSGGCLWLSEVPLVAGRMDPASSWFSSSVYFKRKL